MVPAGRLSHLHLLAGLLVASSSLHIEVQLRQLKYTLREYHPPKPPVMRPTPRPCSHLVSRGELTKVPARFYPVENRLPGRIKGSPGRPVLCRATALQSSTTRRASPPQVDDSSGILRVGALRLALASCSRNPGYYSPNSGPRPQGINTGCSSSPYPNLPMACLVSHSVQQPPLLLGFQA
jgi:hypothetical protein